MGLVVPDGGKNGNIGEILLDLKHGLPNHFQIHGLRGVPDVVGNDVSCPNDERKVLHKGEAFKKRLIKLFTETYQLFCSVNYLNF